MIANSYHLYRNDVLDPIGGRAHLAFDPGGRHEPPPTKGAKMYATPSRLPETARARIADALNAVLADGLDLHAATKVAHWNLKGPQFPALHALSEEIATGLAAQNDDVAERAVTLGARALGTVRHVARSSRLPDYPQETARDLEHVRLVAARLEAYLDGVRAARDVADEHGDQDTVDLLTGTVRDFEKHGWMLRATLE
jgi:starvation-inducible DNA-binding protein